MIYDVELIPVNYLGPLGKLAYNIGKNYPQFAKFLNLFAIIIHFIEGFYALYLCRKLKYSLNCTMKWFVQTVILGFPSLILLIKQKQRKFLD